VQSEGEEADWEGVGKGGGIREWITSRMRRGVRVRVRRRWS
jgi:hypothetical protein